MQGRRPAFPEDPDLISPGGELALWFTQPPGAVAQMTAPMVGTAGMARWLVTEARDALYARFPDVQSFYFVFDLSPMTSREPAMRSIIAEAGKEMKKRVTRAVLIPANNGIYVKSLAVAVLLLRGFGVNVELSKSLPHALSTLGLVAARANVPTALSVRERPR